jgi:hypothetical protein
MRTRLFIASLGFAAFGAVVLADSRVEFKATEGGGASFQTMLIGQGKLRSDEGKTQSAIIDPTGGLMILLDHQRRTFTKIGRAELDQLVKALGDMAKQMEQIMASIPPEMRDMMRGRGVGMPGAPEPTTMVETDERATVAGKACRIYHRKVGDRTTAEYCLADPSVLELPAADRATLTAAVAWSQELLDTLAKSPMGRMADATPFKNGLVPLRVTELSGSTRRTSEFTGVSTAALPPGTFDVPKTYTEQKLEIPRIGRGGRGGR